VAEGGSVRIAVVCEDRADSKTATMLADRQLVETSDWLTPDLLEHVRRYIGADDARPFIKWIDVSRLAAEAPAGGLRTRIMGRFGGEPGAPDAASARKILLWLHARESLPEAVILVRDLDQEPRRLTGLRQARDTTPWSFQVVIAAADPKREAWVLAGFDPAEKGEEQRLSELRQELGFDPCTDAHRLTAADELAKRSAKRVLAALVAEDAEREARCLEGAPLAMLRQRGQQSGLSDYLEEVRERLSPLLDGK
jgi:hypothetical protein